VVNPQTVLSGPAFGLQILHADGALYVIVALHDGELVNCAVIVCVVPSEFILFIV
jgi:hypothetical protein